jgi:hypothetical protein
MLAMTDKPIPGRPIKAPIDTHGMMPPSSDFPRPPLPDRSGEQPWVGKRKKKPARR